MQYAPPVPSKAARPRLRLIEVAWADRGSRAIPAPRLGRWGEGSAPTRWLGGVEVPDNGGSYSSAADYEQSPLQLNNSTWRSTTGPPFTTVRW